MSEYINEKKVLITYYDKENDTVLKVYDLQIPLYEISFGQAYVGHEMSKRTEVINIFDNVSYVYKTQKPYRILKLLLLNDQKLYVCNNRSMAVYKMALDNEKLVNCHVVDLRLLNYDNLAIYTNIFVYQLCKDFDKYIDFIFNSNETSCQIIASNSPDQKKTAIEKLKNNYEFRQYENHMRDICSKAASNSFGFAYNVFDQDNFYIRGTEEKDKKNIKQELKTRQIIKDYKKNEELYNRKIQKIKEEIKSTKDFKKIKEVKPYVKFVFSCSIDYTIKIWNVNTYECVKTLTGHNDTVMALILDLESKRLFSCSCDKSIRVWSLDTYECVKTLTGHNGWVRTLVHDQKSKRLFSGSNDKSIKVWSLETYECQQTLTGHYGWVNALVLDHESKRLFSGSNDEKIRVWSLDTYECVKTLKGHGNNVTSLVLDHESKRLLSGSADDSIKVWNYKSYECVKTLKGHDRGVYALILDHESKRLLSGSYDKRIKIWCLKSYECVKTLTGHDDGVNSLVLDQESERLFSCSHDKSIKIWCLKYYECVNTLTGHSGIIVSLAM